MATTSLAVLAVVAHTAFAQSETVAVESLLREMTDLESLASWPSPPYLARQVTTYDRRSKDPSDALTWFANTDHWSHMPVPNTSGFTEFVEPVTWKVTETWEQRQEPIVQELRRRISELEAQRKDLSQNLAGGQQRREQIEQAWLANNTR